MGVYLAIPGADYSASPAKVGAQTFLTDDPLPYLSLPGLVNWWRGSDAAVAASIASWKGRVSGEVLAGDAVSSPVLETVSGMQGVKFQGGQTMGGAASLVKNSAYTWVFVTKPVGPLTTGTHVTARGGANPLLAQFQFNDGSLKMRAASTTPSQPQSTVGKITPDAFNIIAGSFDSNGVKYGFSFNGVFDKYVPITAGQAGAETAPTLGVNIGATATLGTPYTGTMFDIFQFDRDIHAPANATYFNWLMAKLKARYGL